MGGLSKVIIACDERIAAKAAGLDQRPLSRREIVKHCEAFGIDEEMCCNRQIRGFSAGQKVRLSFAAMFWTRPHFIVLDEPTNYLDVETVEALSKALRSFRGGMIMVSPDEDFSNKICNERWLMADGKVTVEKLDNGTSALPDGAACGFVRPKAALHFSVVSWPSSWFGLTTHPSPLCNAIEYT